MAMLQGTEAPSDWKAALLKALVQEDNKPSDRKATSRVLALHDEVAHPTEAQQVLYLTYHASSSSLC